MSKFIEITGGRPLEGAVCVGGAKNAVLPMLIASLMTADVCEFENVPNLQDVIFTVNLLEYFGAEVDYFDRTVKVRVPSLRATEASYSLVKAMRASFWVLAPLLARGGAARVALPGGDVIGARPVDMHLAGLTAMGADIKIKHGVVYATAVNGLRPAAIDLRFPSVGATHQLLMAAALTPGTTVIRGAAKEPEVIALADLINNMGGDVEGAGSAEIVVRGVQELGGGRARILGDRIEAGTFLLAAAASGGCVRVDGFDPQHLGDFLQILNDAGLQLEVGADHVLARRSGALRPVHVASGPFPELATDLQAPLMAALCLAVGESSIEENVFEGRFGHVSELCRMGARIMVEDRTAKISGVERMTGAPVEAFDIRGAASLVIAAMAAEGVSQIYGAHHLERGYSDFETKLTTLGAHIGFRVSDPEDFIFTGC